MIVANDLRFSRVTRIGFNNFFIRERPNEPETVRDVIGTVSGDSILMSKQSMHERGWMPHAQLRLCPSPATLPLLSRPLSFFDGGDSLRVDISNYKVT